ncbi:GTPase Era [Candidatus Latescibacterota bacterium]
MKKIVLPLEKNTLKTEHVCGFVAIVGLPNSGKSTLMNSYLKEKVSIVTPKPQTTRSNVTTILSSDNYQIIFIDTPGMLRPQYKMQEVMASLVRKAVSDSDLILVMVDASKFNGKYAQPFIEFADDIKSKEVIVVLNKIDIIKKETLLEMIQVTAELFPDKEIVPISALKGSGTDILFTEIIKKLPISCKLYPDNIISTEPERFFVAEIIREAIFLTTTEEIPYSSSVIIEGFEEKKSNIVIHATIIVEKKSQKPIIIGKNGNTIKKIGTKARFGIEEFLNSKVYLDIHVKVRKDWRNNDNFLREIGFERK